MSFSYSYNCLTVSQTQLNLSDIFLRMYFHLRIVEFCKSTVTVVSWHNLLVAPGHALDCVVSCLIHSGLLLLISADLHRSQHWLQFISINKKTQKKTKPKNTSWMRIIRYCHGLQRKVCLQQHATLLCFNSLPLASALWQAHVT